MTLLDQDLFQILRGYGSLQPPTLLSFPTRVPLSRVHKFLLEYIYLNSHFRAYPPSNNFEKSFWKWAISHLEKSKPDEDFDGIDLRIYQHYVSLLNPVIRLPTNTGNQYERCQKQLVPSPSFLTHFWNPQGNAGSKSSDVVDISYFETLTLFESRTTIEGGSTGLRTWLASFVLAQYLTNRPELVRNKVVLELGSGTGFVGMVVSRLQQLHCTDMSSSGLWMTDVNEEVLVRCKFNVQMTCNMSSQSPNIRYCFLNWYDALDLTKIQGLQKLFREEIRGDLVLGADLIFDPSLVTALAAVLQLVLHHQMSTNGPKMAVIAATIRNEETFSRFLDDLKGRNLFAEELPVEYLSMIFIQSLDENRIEDVKILKIMHC